MSEQNYAFIKNGMVINVVVFNNPDQEFLQSFIDNFELDEIIPANYNSIVGGTYDGQKFWMPQPYPSWVKNEELNQWDPPVPYPTFDQANYKNYRWNEEILNWEEIQVSE